MDQALFVSVPFFFPLVAWPRMRGASNWICSNCIRLQKLHGNQSIPWRFHLRPFSSAEQLSEGQATAPKNDEDVRPQDEGEKEKEIGAMSKRLAEMAEETMDTGSRSDRKMMEDAGFSEELKKQLEDRITQTAFRSQNQQAVSGAEMPVRRLPRMSIAQEQS